MSPFEEHATGSRAIWRQSWHEAKGKKESLERRVAWDPQLVLRRDRSWDVKKAREVFRLPEAEVSTYHHEMEHWLTVRHLGQKD